jgi:hypothetical protein
MYFVTYHAPNCLKKFHFSKVTLQFCFEESPESTIKCHIWPMQRACKVQGAFNTCFLNFNEMCTNANISTHFQPCNMLFILTSIVLTSTRLLGLIRVNLKLTLSSASIWACFHPLYHLSVVFAK